MTNGDEVLVSLAASNTGYMGGTAAQPPRLARPTARTVLFIFRPIEQETAKRGNCRKSRACASPWDGGSLPRRMAARAMAWISSQEDGLSRLPPPIAAAGPGRGIIEESSPRRPHHRQAPGNSQVKLACTIQGPARLAEGRQATVYHLAFPAAPRIHMEKIRLDKWLWAARFYKTRSLASQEIGKGRILVNGQPAKPAREVAPGDRIQVRKEDPAIEVLVRAVSGARAARRWRGSSTRKRPKARRRANAPPSSGGWRPSRRWTWPTVGRPARPPPDRPHARQVGGRPNQSARPTISGSSAMSGSPLLPSYGRRLST